MTHEKLKKPDLNQPEIRKEDDSCDERVTFITGCALCDLDLKCTRDHSLDKWYRKK